MTTKERYTWEKGGRLTTLAVPSTIQILWYAPYDAKSRYLDLTLLRKASYIYVAYVAAVYRATIMGVGEERRGRGGKKKHLPGDAVKTRIKSSSAFRDMGTCLCTANQNVSLSTQWALTQVSHCVLYFRSTSVTRLLKKELHCFRTYWGRNCYHVTSVHIEERFCPWVIFKHSSQFRKLWSY